VVMAIGRRETVKKEQTYQNLLRRRTGRYLYFTQATTIDMIGRPEFSPSEKPYHQHRAVQDMGGLVSKTERTGSAKLGQFVSRLKTWLIRR